VSQQDQQYQPAPQFQPQPYQPQWAPVPPPKKKRTGLKILIGSMAALFVTVVACTAAVAGGGSTDVAQDPTQVASARAQSTTAPKADPTEKAEPAQPKMTRSEEQAVKSAESYIESGSFSKKGLVRQLSSDIEGFSKKDAKFAVAYIDPDFDAEARQAAESYMDSGSFSKAALLRQLESDIEGFTDAQAEQAVKAVY